VGVDREAHNARMRDYYKRHREEHLARCREYRAKNPDYIQKWKDEHPGYDKKWREEHPGYSTEKTSVWRRNHPLEWRAHHKANEHKRRRALNNGDLTGEQWLELLAQCNYKCVKCGKPYKHMDHIIPISRGGKHTLSNVQPLCAKCNLSKGAK
jgi:5-methylcytosine-specific restriction endonuclease McrA